MPGGDLPEPDRPTGLFRLPGGHVLELDQTGLVHRLWSGVVPSVHTGDFLPALFRRLDFQLGEEHLVLQLLGRFLHKPDRLGRLPTVCGGVLLAVAGTDHVHFVR